MDSESSTSAWLSKLESSGWLRQLQLIINAGNVVASSIQKGSFILVSSGTRFFLVPCLIFSMFAGSQKKCQFALHSPKLSALLEACSRDQAPKKSKHTVKILAPVYLLENFHAWTRLWAVQ